VNTFSEDLGEEGMTAIEFFLEKGRQAGIFSDSIDNTPIISY
jgi:predicted solute-binding protein